MRSLGKALIHYDLVSLQEEEIRTQTDTEGRHCETQGEDIHLQVKERGLRRNRLCQHLDLRF